MLNVLVVFLLGAVRSPRCEEWCKAPCHEQKQVPETETDPYIIRIRSRYLRKLQELLQSKQHPKSGRPFSQAQLQKVKQTYAALLLSKQQRVLRSTSAVVENDQLNSDVTDECVGCGPAHGCRPATFNQKKCDQHDGDCLLEQAALLDENAQIQGVEVNVAGDAAAFDPKQEDGSLWKVVLCKLPENEKDDPDLFSEEDALRIVEDVREQQGTNRWLGSGNDAFVYFSSPTGSHREYAVKVANSVPKGLLLPGEAKVLHAMQDRFLRRDDRQAAKHLQRLYGYVEDKVSGEFFLIMERLSGGTLHEVLVAGDYYRSASKRLKLLGILQEKLALCFSSAGRIHGDLHWFNVMFRRPPQYGASTGEEEDSLLEPVFIDYGRSRVGSETGIEMEKLRLVTLLVLDPEDLRRLTPPQATYSASHHRQRHHVFRELVVKFFARHRELDWSKRTLALWQRYYVPVQDAIVASQIGAKEAAWCADAATATLRDMANSELRENTPHIL